MANERFASYATEFTWGTLPTTGWYRLAVLTSSTVALNRDTVASQAISGLRGITNVRAGNDNITGTMGFEVAVNGMEPIWYQTLGMAYSDGASPTDTTGQVRTSFSAGGTVVPVDAAAAGAVSVGNFIRIGVDAGTHTFIRKVSAIDTTGGSETITVDYPVPWDLTTSDDIFTVVAPYTHVFERSVLPLGFSIQNNFEDVAQFYKYSGLKVGSLALTIPNTGLATASAEIRGKTSVRAGTATGGALSAAEVLPYISWEGAVEENAIAFGLLTGLNFTIDNELDENIFVIGDRERGQLPFGRGGISGTATFIFEDATIADKFRNETESSLQLTFTNSTNSTEIFIPAVKYTGGAGDPTLESAFGPLNLTLPFQGVQDTVEGTDIRVTVVGTNYFFG